MLTELGNLTDQVWATRIDQRGKEQVHAILDHDHVMCLVTGYKVQLRMAVIQRLRALESGEATPWYEQQQSAVQLPDFTNPAEAARAWAEQYDRADTAEALLTDAREELNFLTVAEFTARRGTYRSVPWRQRLGKKASDLSRKLGRRMEKADRWRLDESGEHVPCTVGIYELEVLEMAERLMGLQPKPRFNGTPAPTVRPRIH